jgi:hypothetical protein
VEPALQPKKEHPWALAIFIVAAGSLFYAAHPELFVPQFYSYPPQPIAPPDPLRYFIMKVVMSVAFGATSIFVILSKGFAPKDKHWAYGTAGLIIGFWLH